MIRYYTPTEDIEALIRKSKPSWYKRACKRSMRHRNAGRYIKKGELLPDGKKATDFWGEVKSVFITVQYGKCAFCETGDQVFAVEHFRPKAKVVEWTKSAFPTGVAMPGGYYLLAYDTDNYIASCSVCNIAKGMYFPIANNRVEHGISVPAHSSEGAYLIYPLGDNAEDPEEHIEFDDVQAIAKNGSVRGQLIIDVCDLNREWLQVQRAKWLVNMFANAYESYRLGSSFGRNSMKWLLSGKAPYTNCVRCFLKLYEENPSEAERKYDKMQKIVQKATEWSATIPS